MSWPDVTVVDACVLRDGRGGSPTAVTDDDPAATDADRRAVAAAAGTSHAAFLGPGRTPDGGWPVRFFTATAELSGCGHGTVAAQAVRLTRTALGELNDRQHTGGRGFDTVAIRRPAGIEVWFDQGLVALRHPAPDERAAIVAAFGLTADDPHPTDAPRIAAPPPHHAAWPPTCSTRQGHRRSRSRWSRGDTLGRPASVLASARRGPAGITTRVGGLAVIRDGH
jgi:trans-2,3-dihydro-3-hydroxyanthranilate isomerase